MADNCIVVQGLSKSFGDFLLDNVSFNVPTGRIVGFIGENGAGKSTTIKLILNELKRDAGRIEVFGRDNTNSSFKNDIGVVFDECTFHSVFNSQDMGKIFSGIYPTWDDGLYHKYLKQFRLPTDKPIGSFSKGMKILQQEAEDAATVQKFTALSEQELDRIESLVQSLLKMARLDAGAITLEQLPENLSELLEHIKGQYSFRAEQEGKEIDLEGDEQAVLLCDRIWLTEAIGNLMKNALDHTAQGDRILIRWHQSPCLTTISMEDTGCGIHRSDLYHIFKRFYRSRFSKDTQGIGLGLPLAKSIIEAHQGSIEVYSELGHGTTFTINFPIMTKL